MLLGKQLLPSLFREKSEIRQKVGQSSEVNYKTKSDTVAYPRKKRWSKSRLGVKNIACYDADQEMLDSDPTADIMDNNSNVTFSTCDSDNSSDIDFVPWSLQISLCNFELYI